MAFNISYIFQAVNKFSPVAKEIAENMETVKTAAESVGEEFEGLDGRFKEMGKKMSLFVSAPILGFAGLTLHAAAAQQTIDAQMENIIGNTEKAKQLADSLSDLKAQAPIDVEGVDNAALRLLVMGTSVDKVSGIMKTFSTIAAGSGEDIGELTEQFAVASSGPQQMSRALLTLSRTLPIMQEMQAIFKEKFHKNIDQKQLQTLISAGKVDISVLEEAFTRMASKGGKFYGALDKQGETINGALKILHNSFDELSEDMGFVILKIFNLGGGLKSLADKLVHFRESFNAFAEKNPALTKTIVLIIAAIAAIGPVLIILGFAMSALSSVGAGLVLLASPLGLIVGGVIAVAAAFTYLYFKSAIIRGIINGILDVIGGLISTFPVLTSLIIAGSIAAFAMGNGSLVIKAGLLAARIAVLAFSAVMEGLPAILAVARGAMLALNIAFRANPFGIAVTAAMALVTAIGYVLNKFGVFDGIITSIKAKIDALASAIKSLFATFDIGAKIGNIKASLSNGVTNIENKITGFFKPSTELNPLKPPSINQPVMASQLINTQNKSTVDINLKGNTDVVGNVQAKSTANTNLNVGKNMAFAR